MKTWFAAAAALFAAGDYAGILMPQYFSVYAALAVVFAVLMAAAAKFKPQTYGAAICHISPYIFYLVRHGGRQ